MYGLTWSNKHSYRLQVDQFLLTDGAVTPIHSAVSFFVLCFASTFVPPTSSITCHKNEMIDDMTSYKLSEVE